MHRTRYLKAWLGSLLIAFSLFSTKSWAADPIIVIGEAASGLSQGEISLEDVLEMALKDNPQKKALELQGTAAHYAVVAEEPILPPPTLSLGSMGSDGPLSSEGHMETSVTLTQTIPFPTKVIAHRRALKQQSLAADAGFKTFEIQLRAEVKKAFFNYLEAQNKLALLNELKSVFEHHLKRLRSGSIQDQIMKSHILSTETESISLENEIIENEQNYKVARGELNYLIGREATASLGSPKEPPLSPLPELPESQFLEAIIQNHPESMAIEAERKLADAEKDSARSAWLPDLSLSYRYNRRYNDGNNPMSNTTPSNSEVMAGVSIPFLFFWQPAAKNSQASARLESMKSKVLQGRNQLSLKILKTQSAMETLSRQIENLENNLIPRAKKRVSLLESLSPTDLANLMEHRDALSEYIKAKMEVVVKKSQYEKWVADFESLVPKNSPRLNRDGDLKQ